MTDSAVSVLDGSAIEPGTHLVTPGAGGGIKDRAVLDRIDVYFRFGSATPAWGAPLSGAEDEYLTYAARPDIDTGFRRKPTRPRGKAWPKRSS